MGIVVAIGMLALSVCAGWAITEGILKLARVEGGDTFSTQGGHHARVLEAQPSTPRVLRGGLWIGILERIAITGAILVGQTQLVGAVVAIKGLGRWADLQDNPAMTERFIIGTIASYICAGACGYAGLWLLAAVS